MKDRLPKDSFQCFVATVNAEQCLNEPSDHGRLHCHGWIVISDNLKWKKFMLGHLSRNGFLKLTKQKHWEKGFDYYVKELDDTSKILDPQLCLLSHYTNLPMRQEILERRILNNKKDIQYCKKKIEDYFSVYESPS